MKLRRESHHVAKIAFLNVQTTFRHTFLYSELKMFAPWRSQKSVRKRKDPITSNFR